MLTEEEEDIRRHWPLVDAADRKEVTSYCQNRVFELDANDATATNQVDGVWVRKWSDRARLIIKSRCCSRGFLDRQRGQLNRHSSTASRLSHRLACSLGIQNGLALQSFDISTAFLQGLRFQDLERKARELGYEVNTKRSIYFAPPANFWRHLRAIDPTIRKQLHDTAVEWEYLYWVLKLLKAIYGLVDGPIMFQLALLHFLTHELRLVKSIHDHNFLYRASGWSLKDAHLICIVLIHVDDLLVWADPNFCKWFQNLMERRFGTMKKSKPPLVFTGITHEDQRWF